MTPYSQDHWLESPPPPSRFRRPWSPDPYDPLPTTSALTTLEQYPHQSAEHWANVRRREPSDVSVEALDLADYARTLNRSNHHLTQQPPFRPYDPYPPSPRAHRPLARTDSGTPPSLVSASASSSQSHAVFSPHSPMRRPYSLPPSSSFPSSPNRSRPRLEPRIASPDTELDISQFPSFARGWFARDDAQDRDNPVFPPTFSHGHGDDPWKKSPFDPTYAHDPFSDPYNPYKSSSPPAYPYGSSYGSKSRSSRDQNMVPWGTDPEGPPVDFDIKEERMRMLEHEFGGKAGQPPPPERVVGSVDDRGKLITDGTKKRLVTRWIQVILALAAVISSIYSGLIIKPPSPAPPAHKLPVYILYILSFITFFGSAFFFLIYPCCCGSRKSKATPFTEGPAGMMVLPVQGFPGGKQKKGKKGKGPPEGNVQVNLIVDPMFGRESERGREEEDEEDDGSSAMPGSYTGLSGSGGQRRRAGPKRRSIFAGLALEEQWMKARKLLKWGTMIDVFAMLLWGTEFVLILLGRRCPVGGYLGWCDAYNIGTAAACLLCFLYGLSLFFDVKDLHASRVSPRTRP